MRSDTLPQIDALADVKRQCVEAVEKVNTRRLRNGIEHIGSELRWDARPFEHSNDGIVNLMLGFLTVEPAHELPQNARITECTVTGRTSQAVPVDHRIKVVAGIFRVESPRKLDRAQHFSREGSTEASELVLEEPIVETRVVGDEHAACETRENFAGHFTKGRRVGHHRVGDTGQRLNAGRYAAFRIDKRATFA